MSAETHSVALAFEDGVTRFITCRDDQTVADASYRQRINIPLDCRDGACGTCKAFCESGTYDGGNYIDDALSPDEASAGYALPCCMKPSSDLVLRIATTSDSAKTQATTYRGKVVQLDRLSPTTVKLGIDIPNRRELAFLPGQYVNITVPGTELSRSYSFSNGPHDDGLTFLIKLTPGGAMSEYLDKRAKVGDEIGFTGPNGSFFLREASHPVLLLAGGTGLAPVLSILRSMRAKGANHETHLIYGVSTDHDLTAIDEIDDIAATLPNFTWDYCVTDANSTAPNKGPEKAYVTNLIEPEHVNGGNVAIYLCGPPPMVEAVRSHLGKVQIEPLGFYYEKFGLAKPAGAATPAAAFAEAPKPPVVEDIQLTPEARAVAGQTVLPETVLVPLVNPAPAADDGDAIRRVAGQLMADASVAGGAKHPIDGDDGRLYPSGARSLAGQTMLPSGTEVATALTAAAPGVGVAAAGDTSVAARDNLVTRDGYHIGEEHPEVHESDALFEARSALELGALELALGRLDTQQLAGYRLLAESTLRFVDGEHFVDAEQFTESNAAFHDYLFGLTGNDHLLHAYQALEVKGRMTEVLRTAIWCHPLCAQDHVDIVAAFEAEDRDAARALIVAHADRSKQTMRRAMADHEAAVTKAFVTPGRFAGKVVVVTGAAQGIGERTARRVHAEGGTLVLADRSELVKELADELNDRNGAAVAVTVDLEHSEGAEALLRQAISSYGRVDVLINNVGGAINFKPFTEFTAEEVRAEIDRSLMTTLFACHAVLPTMVDSGHGVIVNVSSAATRGINRIPYSAAKGGVNAITASLAMEYAEAGIRVVATAPGGTAAPKRRVSRGTPEPTSTTEQAWFDAHIEQTIGSSLLKRYGTLDEQAAAICFLASDEASYITGTVLPVAGGDLG